MLDRKLQKDVLNKFNTNFLTAQKLCELTTRTHRFRRLSFFIKKTGLERFLYIHSNQTDFVWQIKLIQT